MVNENSYELAKWVSTRVYSIDLETKAVISNELDREFLELESNAAILWQAILNNEYNFTPELISKNIKKPLSEVSKFIEKLESLNLIKKISDKNEKPLIEIEKRNFNSSDRYTSGDYNEPTPGGTNLEAEFKLMEWCVDKGFLYASSWEMTYRCNERCTHCFNPGASHVEGDKSFRKVKELT